MTDEWPRHRTARPNLEFIGKHGAEKWLQVQQQEWSCPACGARSHWYQQRCGCGQDLDGWALPASESQET